MNTDALQEAMAADRQVTEGLLDNIRSENLNVYRASPQRLREDVGQESQIAQDYRGRLVYELLQNADDAMDMGAGSACIRFHLTDTDLWVSNSGGALDEADIRGLCGISARKKSGQRELKRRASIGHKGMGFKSVLEITDAPEVFSTTVCFRGPRSSPRPLKDPATDCGGTAILRRSPPALAPHHLDGRPGLQRHLS